MAALLTGCGEEHVDSTPMADPMMEEPAQPPVSVLDPFALTPVTADLDPLAHHRPLDVDCPSATWGPEGGGFEVQTGACAYGAFDQPLPMDLEAGDTLVITVWHDFLDAPEPAEGHIAVWIDDTVIWEEVVQIPAPSRTLGAEVALDFTPTPDARLGLHLHNHGFNSWRLVSINALRR
ncbi:MAG: hypothetical protein ACE366_13895 [Bradymonadia bacterium]